MGLLNVRALTEKTQLCQDFIKLHKLDFFFITEAWLQEDANVTLIATAPPNFSYFNLPRPDKTGGGLAVFYNNTFKCSPITFGNFRSFEVFCFLINGPDPVLCVLIYRPPNGKCGFITEFSEFLSIITQRFGNICLVGDYNINVCCPSHPLSTTFTNLIDSFGINQSVKEPTHRKGHTLDLVMSLGLAIHNVELFDFVLSDHKAIVFKTTLPCPTPKCSVPVRSRIFNSKCASAFRNAFTALPLPPICELPDIDALITNFNSKCTSILDSIAPFKVRIPKRNTQPWLNEHTRSLRRECRRAERSWRANKLPSALISLKELMIRYQSTVKLAKSNYYSNIISENSNNPRVLFKIINSVISPPAITHIDPAPEDFLSFFINKIETIRLQIPSSSADNSVPPYIPSSLNQFEPSTLPLIISTISLMKSSSSQLDLIPTPFLKEVSTSLAPTILSIINNAIAFGFFPTSFKHALVYPLLKKPGLDPHVPSSYRPISNLSFLSKLLEKVISSQLIDHLQHNNLFETFQSGFRALHSTETALVKVTNDLLMTLDGGDSSVLVLLDLSAAFDTVDHLLLVKRLESWVGLGGNALQLLRSYLENRTFSVAVNNSTSSSAQLTCGVPQGSILGPLLFSVYLLPLGHVIRKHNIQFHFYADDTQLYLPLKTSDPNCLSSLKACLTDIQLWMSQNFLQLNSDKSEIILFGPLSSHTTILHNLGPLAANVTPVVKNLGVQLDSELRFEIQIKKVVQTCFMHIRNINKIKSFLSADNLKTAVNALVYSRLDYCNALYSGVNQNLIHRLQLVQNAAARLITGTRKYDHITPVLAALHWLPVSFRINFKILLLTFKALNGLAPSYLSEMVKPYEPSRTLRSSGRGLLKEHDKATLVTRGDRAFSVKAPKLWNSLPEELRLTKSLTSFKSLLKTHFYKMAFASSSL